VSDSTPVLPGQEVGEIQGPVQENPGENQSPLQPEFTSTDERVRHRRIQWEARQAIRKEAGL